ncbi:hypothetical protein [Acinetobacter calcoaceticus]|uniref:hypothetical protein n=1 Tax=Acinetobacter calcoaceticus TaxID=471 RepID=UPI003A8AD5D5
MKNTIFIILVTLLIGCNAIDPAAYKRSSIKFRDGGGLSVWNSDLTAAVENQKGGICMQKALTARALSTNSELVITDAVLKIVEAIPKTKTSTDELIRFQHSMSETLAILTTTTERTAFLDSGLFYICQFGINNTINQAQAMELTKVLIETTAKMDPKTGNINHVNGPAIANPKPPAK